MPRRTPDRDAAERELWRRIPRGRPRRVPRPGPGEESVWDYPRPPRIEPEPRTVCVEFGGEVVAHSGRALRVCETAGPPTFYLPRADVSTRRLEPSDLRTLCEWKGRARYWSLRVGDRYSQNAAWSYPDPTPGFEALRDHFAFFAGRVDACSVGGVAVRPQPGGFYGGWITPEVLGPFKGEPGTEGW